MTNRLRIARCHEMIAEAERWAAWFQERADHWAKTQPGTEWEQFLRKRLARTHKNIEHLRSWLPILENLMYSDRPADATDAYTPRWRPS